MVLWPSVEGGNDDPDAVPQLQSVNVSATAEQWRRSVGDNVSLQAAGVRWESRRSYACGVTLTGIKIK